MIHKSNTRGKNEEDDKDAKVTKKRRTAINMNNKKEEDEDEDEYKDENRSDAITLHGGEGAQRQQKMSLLSPSFF